MENVLCTLTEQGGCEEQTTECKQYRGKTYCKCKPGYENHSDEDKICRGK